MDYAGWLSVEVTLIDDVDLAKSIEKHLRCDAVIVAEQLFGGAEDRCRSDAAAWRLGFEDDHIEIGMGVYELLRLRLDGLGNILTALIADDAVTFRLGVDDRDASARCTEHRRFGAERDDLGILKRFEDRGDLFRGSVITARLA